MCPNLTPASQAGTQFTYPGGMEGWVDLGSLTTARPGIEPMTAWSKVRRANHYTTKPPVHSVKVPSTSMGVGLLYESQLYYNALTWQTDCRRGRQK